jgi:electron transfer flavoprotein beta subunit
MRGIMAARTKPLQLLQPQTVADFSASKSYELPTAKTGVKMIDPENAAQLIDILRNEAKVI